VEFKVSSGTLHHFGAHEGGLYIVHLFGQPVRSTQICVWNRVHHTCGLTVFFLGFGEVQTVHDVHSTELQQLFATNKYLPYSRPCRGS
jgi:hypothetical protein